MGERGSLTVELKNYAPIYIWLLYEHNSCFYDLICLGAQLVRRVGELKAGRGIHGSEALWDRPVILLAGIPHNRGETGYA